MPDRAQVAVLYTQPEPVLQDYQRLFELAGGAQALQPGATTILKDNITWHFPMPGANTTPWQLEGTILALRQAGFDDLVCVQNQTVVTNAFKGQDLNKYVPIFKRYVSLITTSCAVFSPISSRASNHDIVDYFGAIRTNKL